jgi:hypothetical protein
MPVDIAPALAATEWAERRAGSISLDAARPQQRLVLSPETGTDAAVSGSREIFALIALANQALPEDDSRKITAAKLDALREAVREWHRCWLGMAGGSLEKLQQMPEFEPRRLMLEETVATLAAILPPLADTTLSPIPSRAGISSQSEMSD